MTGARSEAVVSPWWRLGAVVVLLMAGVGARGGDSERLDAVARLIEESSAGRRFEDGAPADALAGRERARVLLAEARELGAAGADAEEVNALLAEATREMLAAVRLLEDGESAHSVLEREYEKLAASLESLRDA